MPTKTTKPAPKTTLANSKEGLALQKLLMDNGAIDVTALNALIAKKGYKVVARAIQEERYSRTGKVREWATADRTLTKEERALIRRLPQVVGQAPAITSEDQPQELDQEAIDLWCEELEIERPIIDLLKGLNERFRSTFINAAAALHGGDALVGHTFFSMKHRRKVVVSKGGNSSDPDYSLLEGLLDEDTWNEVSDPVVVRKVNEDKVNQALADGKITMEMWLSLIPEKKEWPVVTFKPIKEGDVIG